MEYFTKGLKSVLGTPDSTNQTPTGADIVERIVDRLQSSTLLDDRRDACRALKALSRTYRVEVGAQGMNSLHQVLEMDRLDGEIIGLALDTLFNITSPEIFDDEITTNNTNIGEQFTEILIKNNDTFVQILSTLEDFDFRVRWPALKLLTNLIQNRPKDIQDMILKMPMGISKLMDLLSDTREIIRNDALLLLIQLTKSNANIQKIVAFENAFDRIFDVIKHEGGANGGIIVEDCLLLMLNLLKGNISNQNFFNEGSYIQRLTPLFSQLPTNNYSNSQLNDNNINDINDDNNISLNNINWCPQKVANVHCMIQVIRAIVAPSCTLQSIQSCQNIMFKCGLLKSLCDLLMISGVPADILTETINTVGEVIRGNKINQEFLSNVMAPSTPPRTAIVVLLMSMINEKQPFQLRCAVLYCFQCYLYKNEIIQMQLIQTLLPQSNETQLLTTGQLLCGGLFSSDTLSNWYSSVALSHSLIDNSSKQKEQLLRVLLATNIGKPPVTLMQQCIMLLQQQQLNNNKIQSKLGLMILLCRWMENCTIAVKTFLNIDTSVSYLIGILSSYDNNDDLYEIIMHSMCALLLGICIHFNDCNDDNIDDYGGYTKLKLYNLIEKRIGIERYQNALGGITRNEIYSRTLKHPQPSVKLSSELLLDHEFCRLLKTLEGKILDTILKINNTINLNSNDTTLLSNDISIGNSTLMVSSYKDLIREQDIQIQKLKLNYDNIIKEKLQLENINNELNIELGNLRDQNIILRGSQIDNDKLNSNIKNDDNIKYENIISELKLKLDNCYLKINELEKNTMVMTNEMKIDVTLDENNYEKLYREKLSELEKLKKDQDDLLELLADQDTKLIAYKEKLLALGEKIETDESSGEIDTDDQPESSN